MSKEPVQFTFVRSFSSPEIAAQFIETLGDKHKYFIINVPDNPHSTPSHDMCVGGYVSVVASMNCFDGAPR